MRETELTRFWVKGLLPVRKQDGHKGDFGKLLVIGGSVGYTGAPYLAASAAEHSGCGLVYLGVPESIWAMEAAKCAGAMPFPLPEAEGRLCLASLDAMHDKLAGCDVIALGPGLGRGKETERLDDRRGRVTIITPHDGEFARLSGRTLEELSSKDRAAYACEFAERYGCCVVLKGHRTLIALPDGTLYRNTSGTSALSKGGSGDVLTGLIAALLCQGANARDAAALGVWMHGRAGELLEEEMTAYCASPLALIERGLPRAFRELC